VEEGRHADVTMSTSGSTTSSYPVRVLADVAELLLPALDSATFPPTLVQSPDRRSPQCRERDDLRPVGELLVLVEVIPPDEPAPTSPTRIMMTLLQSYSKRT